MITEQNNRKTVGPKSIHPSDNRLKESKYFILTPHSVFRVYKSTGWLSVGCGGVRFDLVINVAGYLWFCFLKDLSLSWDGSEFPDGLAMGSRAPRPSRPGLFFHSPVPLNQLVLVSSPKYMLRCQTVFIWTLAIYMDILKITSALLSACRKQPHEDLAGTF